jgi:hypothetical protein
MEYVTGKELLKRHQKHEIIDMMRKKQLTPYSPATLKPYRQVILSPTGGSKYPSNPLSDNILPYAVDPYSKLYLYLEEVLFDVKEVDLLHVSEPKILIRSQVVMAMAKLLKKSNEKMRFPEVAEEINSYLKDNKLKPYSNNQLRRIISDSGFLPGKSGPKSKK